jgi:hypothetical protein
MSLPMREREAVRKSMQDEYNQTLDQEEVNLFVQFVKIVCIILHDYFGWGEKRLTYLIGCFRMLHRKFRKLKTAKENNEALDKEMARIFKKGGFPQDYVESLQREK